MECAQRDGLLEPDGTIVSSGDARALVRADDRDRRLTSKARAVREVELPRQAS
jgi:hypothetical protein